jgi:RNA recognition motif-containing protein
MEEKIRSYIEENVGPVKKIKLFEFNPDGIAKIKFLHDKHAELCVKQVNGQVFNQRVVECFYYDGETDYTHVKEKLEDEQRRIAEFEKFLV